MLSLIQTRFAARFLQSGQPVLSLATRTASSATIQAESEAEKAIANKLAAAFKATDIFVQDASGGCGSLYNIQVIANDFQGMSTVKQHQAVHKVLKEDIAQWHGLNLITKPPQ